MQLHKRVDVLSYDRLSARGSRLFNLTAATFAFQRSVHDGQTITANKADGSTLILDPALGLGTRYRVFVGTTITSVGLIVKVANATDVMAGSALVTQDGGDTVVGFETAATSDTITMNGTTTGGLKGDTIELEDVGVGLWAVRVISAATGTEATPFSATVS